ncbi:hypothetical protein Ancab_018282 [Ancistrocladus abbreviatus]
MKNTHVFPQKPWFVAVGIMGLIAGSLLISIITQFGDKSLLCPVATRLSASTTSSISTATNTATTMQLNAIVHYATSTVVPQQSLEEITVSFNVLRSRPPCNFLVFGLGYDSLMWAALNPNGTTLFLEEDPDWVRTVLKDASDLKAHSVSYRTQLKEAHGLLKSYKREPDCQPSSSRIFLRGNRKCKLALDNLPEEVYEREWDLIMIDAPRGYYPTAPGRMAAIYSAAVMARGRKGGGTTHVFLHDVDRRVEKAFAEEFLCRKYLVEGVGRLWHFEIPPAMAEESGSNSSNGSWFC